MPLSGPASRNRDQNQIEEPLCQEMLAPEVRAKYVVPTLVELASTEAEQEPAALCKSQRTTAFLYLRDPYNWIWN